MDRQQSVYVAAILRRVCRLQARLWKHTRVPVYTASIRDVNTRSRARHTICKRMLEYKALKLSLYFIGRAYKSKASASQILEALHTPICVGDVQNADTWDSIRSTYARLANLLS